MSKGIRATPWTLLKTALLKPPNVLWQFKRVKKGALWERRRLWLNLDNADDIREILDVPDCQIVLRIDRQLTAEDGTVVLHDTRYFISSLDPNTVSAGGLLRHVREH